MLESRDFLILFLAAMIVVLDIFIILLDRKVRKLQESMKNIVSASKDMAKANRESNVLFSQLAGITKSVNNQITDLVSINKFLCDANQTLIKAIQDKEEEEGK